MLTLPDEENGSFIVQLSISGMTCSSCVSVIKESACRLPGVSKVLVNLLQGSASAIVTSKGLATVLCDAIDDSGFDVRIVGFESVHPGDRDTKRTIAFQVDGMSSEDCPRRILAAIEILGGSVTVTKPLITLADPVLVLSYFPTSTLSVRILTNVLANAGTPPFMISVYHPPTAEELDRQTQRRERHSILWRLLFSIVAAVPTFILGVVFSASVTNANPIKIYLMESMWVRNVSRIDWALFITSTPVMFYACSIFHKSSLHRLYALWRPGSSAPYFERFTRFGSMNLLVSLGVSVAYFSSIGVLATQRSGGSKSPMNYFDMVVFLGMFVLAGKYVQAYCKMRTSDAISALRSLRPTEAYLLTPNHAFDPLKSTQKPSESADVFKEEKISHDFSSVGNLTKIHIDYLEVGDIVQVPSGSSPPADGIVTPGQEGHFDESSLTGESRIVTKNSGDTVFTGTINKGQPLSMKVVTIGKKTMHVKLDQIIQVVTDAQTHKAPIEHLADKMTAYFVPFVTLLATTTWIVWLGLGLSEHLPSDYLDAPPSSGTWTVWSLQFAISVFIVACPCGLGLASPTALLVGSGLAAKFGILARGGGEAFEEISQLDLVVFDKTGTLTEGGPRVTDHHILDDTWSRLDVLGIAKEVESVSMHPLASAIREFSKDSLRCPGSNFEEMPGRGVKAIFHGLRCTAIMGNEPWMQEHNVVLSDERRACIQNWKSEGKSVALLAIQKMVSDVFLLAAVFAITDCVRPEASVVISSLRHKGIHTWLLSGDNLETARAVAASVGIPFANVIAGVLPHEKAQHIQALQESGLKKIARTRAFPIKKTRAGNRTIVAMVGDGINDAPALAMADVGVAMGSGSDVALSSASFILLSPDLRSLLTLCDLSQRIINRIKFNFVWATMYNMIAVPIAAGVLYPVHHIRLAPVWASLAMPLSSISVVCSSLLLKLYKPPSYPIV